MSEQQNQQTAALGTAPVGPLLFRLALPTITAQVVNLLYSIVDRIYIGRIPLEGKLALTGMGVTFPVITLISAFAALIGMGGAPRASIALGAKEHDRAERILGTCTAALWALALVLTALFLLFQAPLLKLFGASADTIGYATDYLTIYLLGTIFVQLSLGLNTFISAQGKAMPAMCSVLIGAVLNILLDPLFVLPQFLGLGAVGAGMATALSNGAAVACFAAQMDPTLNELEDIKTAVSEAATNAIVHAYPDSIGKVVVKARICGGDVLELTVRDYGRGIPDIDKARQPMFTTGGDERSGMGFTIMESFMDSLTVRSTAGRGTTVVMKKRIAPRVKR